MPQLFRCLRQEQFCICHRVLQLGPFVMFCNDVTTLEYRNENPKQNLCLVRLVYCGNDQRFEDTFDCNIQLR